MFPPGSGNTARADRIPCEAKLGQTDRKKESTHHQGCWGISRIIQCVGRHLKGRPSHKKRSDCGQHGAPSIGVAASRSRSVAKAEVTAVAMCPDLLGTRWRR